MARSSGKRERIYLCDISWAGTELAQKNLKKKPKKTPENSEVVQNWPIFGVAHTVC
jgi:16S rRNA G1207 methylase RsmC